MTEVPHGMDWPLAAGGAAVGAGLAAVYLAALWWTVRRLPESRHAGLLLLASGVLRVGAVSGVLLLLLFWGWPALVGALLSFTAMRWAVAHRVRRAPGAGGP